MEWVETSGRTVEEALEQALDRLGVDVADAEYEVLDEPKPGLFGKVRVAARLRARVRPVATRLKEPRRAKATEPKVSEGESTDTSSASGPVVPQTRAASPAKASARSRTGARRDTATATATTRVAPPSVPLSAGLDSVVEVAKRFLRGLTDALGLQVEFEVQGIDERTVQVGMVGERLGVLVGQGAKTLEALQELTRTIVHYELGERGTRLMLDIAGYRAKRRAALEQFTGRVVGEIRLSGQSRSLEPMAAVDRKVIHDTVNRLDGVVSESEGEEPERFVIIRAE